MAAKKTRTYNRRTEKFITSFLAKAAKAREKRGALTKLLADNGVSASHLAYWESTRG